MARDTAKAVPVAARVRDAVAVLERVAVANMDNDAVALAWT
jgi:hypothetical protein